MPIVSSVIVDTGVQKDGRKWVRERHVDHVGSLYERTYLAGGADDLDAALAAYALVLASNLTLAEIAANVAAVVANGSLANASMVHSTAAQNRAAGRSAYLSATRTEAIMIGDFLSSLTDGQLQTIFSMSAGQVTTLRTNKLTPAASAAATIRAAAGQ